MEDNYGIGKTYAFNIKEKYDNIRRFKLIINKINELNKIGYITKIIADDDEN